MSSSKPGSVTRSRWFPLVWAIPVALIVLAALVLFAQWWRGTTEMQSFLADYPGETPLPDGAPVGFSAWIGWQHFLNMLMIVLIIRSGWHVRTRKRTTAFWTRNNRGLFRTKGAPKKVSLDLWLHQSLDIFWVLNGLIFYVMLFATGQWMRIVPTSWDVFPNAFSSALQYISLNWPAENGWVNYNSLQLLAYFTTVFIAAPLAIITGIRMSGAWPEKATRLNKVYPIELARIIHFPVMIYFVLFIFVHVTLVLTTGALQNLNHMYAMNDDADSWVGFWIFAGSLVVIVVAWIAARPLFLRPIAAMSGTLSR